MRRRTLALAAIAGGLAAALVACTLNPQPLPPSDFSSAEDSDASTRKDSGSFGDEPPAPSADAAGGGDGGQVSDDGGDAGDAGDAADGGDGGDGG
ncbi:MAG TPA: hypothetical protein VLT33_22215 [Labilithrix sp.]|nr:hypothetical protein [Labilithrix sp.]